MRVKTIGSAVLYHGDCLDIVPALKNVDAIVADPPYGMNFDTDSTRFSGGACKRGAGRSDRKIVGDDRPFDPTPWLEFPEVILWGANHYAQKLPVGSTLIWLKKYREHYGSFLSDAEVAWQKGGHGVYAFHAPDSPSRRRNEFDGQSGGTAHPFQKPISLMTWCVERVKAPLICDPYMGSGTTGIASAKLGRRFIGVESDAQYFDIACRRIDAAHKQADLFTQL